MPHSAQFSLAACVPARDWMVATLLPHARQPRESCTRKPMMGASADGDVVSADDDNGGSEGKRLSCIVQPQSRRPLGGKVRNVVVERRVLLLRLLRFVRHAYADAVDELASERGLLAA